MKLLTTSVRILSRFRLYSIINVLGLMLSLACVIALSRYVHQETTVNRFIDELDRTCLMTSEQENRTRALGSALNVNRREDYVSPLDIPEVEKYSSFIPYSNVQVGANNHRYSVNYFVVDSLFLQLVPYPVVIGSNKLEAPEDVIITSRLAKRLFGKENPIGQKITHVSGDLLNVVGVLGETRTKSSFNFDMLINSDFRQSWTRAPKQLVLLRKGANVEAINQKYGEFGPSSEFKFGGLSRLQLLPLRDFYFDTSLFLGGGHGMLIQGNRTNILVLSVVTALILLVGLFNFINIYTVITLRRGREFGIKKVYGAKGWQIFVQLYLENFLLAAMAVFGAWLVLEILEALLARSFALTLHPNVVFDVALSFVLLFLLPLVTTIFPYLRYNYSSPITSLRSINREGVSLVSRSIFLFMQYVITFGLIVISGYFMKQLRYMLNTDMGYDTGNMITCKIIHRDHFSSGPEKKETGDRFVTITETIEREMNASPLFLHWTHGYPMYSLTPAVPVKVEGGEYINVSVLTMSRKQMEVFNYQLLEGRLWDSTDVAVQYRFIINETAKKLFNITDIHTTYLQPEHRLWYARGDMSTNPAYEIVGVIKDFNTGHLSKPTVPVVIKYMEEYMKHETLIAKIASGKRQEAIAFLKKLNTELYGDAEFNYTFMEDEIAALYADDKRVSRVYTTFSFIAIFISCLGLFALSLFDIRQRYREIALRKVNGAKRRDIMRLLLKKYAYLLGASFVVSVPVTYWVINRYMEDFAHRTAISWWLFAISAVVVTAVSLLTLTWQVRRATNINPASAMKAE
ncbi:MAG: ABC transporter permease [Bacteroidota bacterium]|nr:ABC transporter permease [Bacteroidota bacterium]